LFSFWKPPLECEKPRPALYEQATLKPTNPARQEIASPQRTPLWKRLHNIAIKSQCSVDVNTFYGVDNFKLLSLRHKERAPVRQEQEEHQTKEKPKIRET
jgi:hypothetical protein